MNIYATILHIKSDVEQTRVSGSYFDPDDVGVATDTTWIPETVNYREP